MYSPRTRSEWAFLGISIGQALAAIALESFILGSYYGWIEPEVWQVPRSFAIPVNFGIVVFALVYQVALCYDALREKNTIQIHSICFSNFLLLGFTGLRYEQTREVIDGLSSSLALGNKHLVNTSIDFWTNIRPALVTVPILVGLCALGMSFLAYSLQNEFAWTTYRHISGSRQTRRKFLEYKVLVVLVKVELYLFICFLVVYGLVNVHFVLPEFAITASLVPLALLQVVLVVYFTKTENKLGAIGLVVVRLGEIGYLISRILALTGAGARAAGDTVLGKEMIFFACSALLISACICVNSILCIANFGHGLKALHLIGDKSETAKRPADFQLLNSSRPSLLSTRFELD